MYQKNKYLKAGVKLLENNKKNNRVTLQYAYCTNGFLYITDTILLIKVACDKPDGWYDIKKSSSGGLELFEVKHDFDAPNFEIVIPKETEFFTRVDSTYLSKFGKFAGKICRAYDSWENKGDVYISPAIEDSGVDIYTKVIDNGTEQKLYSSNTYSYQSTTGCCNSEITLLFSSNHIEMLADIFNDSIIELNHTGFSAPVVITGKTVENIIAVLMPKRF